MSNSSAKRSADSRLRDPTATATPESLNRRSETNQRAIRPVARIPHRTGLSDTWYLSSSIGIRRTHLQFGPSLLSLRPYAEINRGFGFGTQRLGAIEWLRKECREDRQYRTRTNA